MQVVGPSQGLALFDGLFGLIVCSLIPYYSVMTRNPADIDGLVLPFVFPLPSITEAMHIVQE